MPPRGIMSYIRTSLEQVPFVADSGESGAFHFVNSSPVLFIRCFVVSCSLFETFNQEEAAEEAEEVANEAGFAAPSLNQ